MNKEHDNLRQMIPPAVDGFDRHFDGYAGDNLPTTKRGFYDTTLENGLIIQCELFSRPEHHHDLYHTIDVNLSISTCLAGLSMIVNVPSQTRPVTFITLRRRFRLTVCKTPTTD